MEKFICIPDSFQGTATSLEVCRIMSRKILEIYPDSEVIAILRQTEGRAVWMCF